MMIPLVMRTPRRCLILVRRATEADWRWESARWKIITVIVVKTAAEGIITGI